MDTSRYNAVTVNDSYSWGTNPNDDDKGDSQSYRKEPVRMGPGSGLDSDTIHSIRAVSASKSGPNVLVATNKLGVLPTKAMPGVSGSFVVAGVTYTLVKGVVTSIV